MKLRNLLLAVCLCSMINISYSYHSIDTIQPITNSDDIFTTVEQMPIFITDCKGTEQERRACGEKALLNFIYKHIKYPTIARENNITGKIVVRFIIEKNGSISNIEIIRNVGAELGEEMVRVIKKIPPQSWEAGKQNGQSVRVQLYLPITICLE